MQALTAAEMRAADRRTTEQFGVPSLVLMENAGAAVAQFALRHFPAARRIVLLAGGGNNGGDGLVAARHLVAAGRTVTVLLLADESRLSADCAAMLERLQLPVSLCPTVEEFRAQQTVLESAELIIDALLGTGFKPPLRQPMAAAIEAVAACAAPVVAVDLPSGWDADSTAQFADHTVPASAIITFTSPRPAHLFGQMTRSWRNPVAVAPIGSPAAAIQSERGLRWAGSALALAQRPRRIDANKGSFGHVLVLGGSPGRTGAAVMAAYATLKAGAGLVTLAVPESQQRLAASFYPELMTHGLAESAAGTICQSNASDLSALLERKTVLAIGPGMGADSSTAAFLERLFAMTDLALVLDADALNAVAAHPQALKAAAARKTLVLTPHPGEMARLAGVSVAEVQANRESIARSFAAEHNCTLVLKGARTVVAHPTGKLSVNTSGNPAMAKGGSGDILAGLVASLMAQHSDEPERAVEAAVYLHGLAADFATASEDEHTVLATDVLRHLFCAFRYRTVTKGGYVYLQGAAQLPPENPIGSEP